MTSGHRSSNTLQRSGHLLALARPQGPVLLVLALLHALELLVLPVLLLLGRDAAGIATPLVVGALARIARLLLHQRARRKLREAFMVVAADDALTLARRSEAGADAAFWGAHILEYAVCVDLPAIGGAAASAVIITGLALARGEVLVVAGCGAIFLAAIALSLLTSRRRRPHVDELVQTRHQMALWMTAAMQDQGELGGERAKATYLQKLAKRAQQWSAAEDSLEHRQALHRGLIVGAATASFLALAQQQKVLGHGQALADLLNFALVATLAPVAYALHVHLESLNVARSELLRLLPHVHRSGTKRTTALLKAPSELHARGLRVRYEDALALDIEGIELDLSRPVVITGPNGAGKTTLARCIAGLVEPSHGALTLNGVPAHELSRDDVRFVPQDPVVLESASVLENLRLVAADCSREEAEHLLSRLGMPRMPGALDEPAGNFSRGEGRRIAAARALLAPASLLVLDEPDAWLDARSREQLVDALFERGRGAALVLVSHRSDVIARFDQIVALSAEHGVEAIGSAAHVHARSPAFRDLMRSAEQPTT